MTCQNGAPNWPECDDLPTTVATTPPTETTLPPPPTTEPAPPTTEPTPTTAAPPETTVATTPPPDTVPETTQPPPETTQPSATTPITVPVFVDPCIDGRTTLIHIQFCGPQNPDWYPWCTDPANMATVAPRYFYELECAATDLSEPSFVEQPVATASTTSAPTVLPETGTGEVLGTAGIGSLALLLGVVITKLVKRRPAIR